MNFIESHVALEGLTSTESRVPSSSYGTNGSTGHDTRRNSSILKASTADSTDLAQSTVRSSRFGQQLTASLPPTTTQSEQRRFCLATHERNIHWPQTEPGETVTMECPNNPEGY